MIFSTSLMCAFVSFVVKDLKSIHPKGTKAKHVGQHRPTLAT